MKKNNHTHTLYQATRRLTLSLPQLLLLALLLTGCANDEYVGGEDINGPAVSFSTNTGGGTRASGAEAATLLGNSFTVFASKKKGAETQPVFPGYVVSYTAHTAGTTNSNTADWEYVGLTSSTGTQLIKYWDLGADKYYFSAYSLGQGAADGTATATHSVSSNALLNSYTLSGTAAQLAACYITNKQEVNPSTAYNSAVKMSFFTLTAKLRIGLYETIPGYSVKEVKFYPSSNASSETDATLFANGAIIPDGGTYTITYDNNGKVKFSHHEDGGKVNIDTGALGNYADKETDEDDGDYLGRSSNTSTITGYQSTLPNPGGCALNLKVDYKLVSTDGSGQEIQVNGASAIVPAAYADWKSNYAYTYIFKINDNTNGYTGDPSDKAGLYPITFDAWAAADGGDSQGTITTVASYSITTTQEGDVNGNKVSYIKDKPIDVTVIKSDGSETEKIVLGNALPNPNDYLVVYLQTTKDEGDVEYGTAGKKEVTYYQGVGTFTPTLDGFYRVEYWHNETPTNSATAEKLAVKIVKVGNPDIEGGSIFAENEEWDNDYHHAKRK